MVAVFLLMLMGRTEFLPRSGRRRPKTIGIAEVAFFAASAGAMPLAMIASTLRPARSTANAVRRS
jgi:hypothetical protein